MEEELEAALRLSKEDAECRLQEDAELELVLEISEQDALEAALKQSEQDARGRPHLNEDEACGDSLATALHTAEQDIHDQVGEDLARAVALNEQQRQAQEDQDLAICLEIDEEETFKRTCEEEDFVAALAIQECEDAENGEAEEEQAALAQEEQARLAQEEQQDEEGAEGNGYEELLQLGEDVGEAVDPGLSQEEIDVLPVNRLRRGPTPGEGSNHETECKVCMTEFEGGDEVRTLPCCHQFHRECIDRWIATKAICPVCRIEIKEELRRGGVW